jgi:hypothetical protein
MRQFYRALSLLWLLRVAARGPGALMRYPDAQGDKAGHLSGLEPNLPGLRSLWAPKETVS